MATAINTIGEVRPAFIGAKARQAELLPLNRDWRAAVRRARSPLQLNDLPRLSVRRFVAEICTAEVEHSRTDFWQRVHAIGAAALSIDTRSPTSTSPSACRTRCGPARRWHGFPIFRGLTAIGAAFGRAGRP